MRVAAIALVLAATLAACEAVPPPASAPPTVVVTPTAPENTAASAASPMPPTPLASFARATDPHQRLDLIASVGDTLGAVGLVRALDHVTTASPERTWTELSAIFSRLHELADPRIGDALVRWADAAPRPVHWKGEVGACLAEIGDLRGARYLAERMGFDPAQVYATERPWELGTGGHLSRTDLPRVVAARLLADLAILHPEAKEQLRAAAPSVQKWVSDRPQPHANAMRFFAAAGVPEALPDLRAWAFPHDPLPAPGAQPPFPAAFETAQSALRYIGWAKDDPSFPRLVAQLQRKDRRLVITQEALQSGGIAMLGIALRAVGYGASQGLGQWGDARAVKPLVAVIEDETWHEEVRFAACEALAWCADDKVLAEVVKKTKAAAGRKELAKAFVGACWASTLATRSTPALVPAMVDLLLTPQLPRSVAAKVARAVGAAGLDESQEARLLAKRGDAAVSSTATLALVLGGSPKAAVSAAAAHAARGEAEIEALKDDYFQALSFWSEADLDRGSLFRWVENAEAIAGASPAGAWARRRLVEQLDNLTFDNGPHSLTRVVARHRLWQIARSGKPAAQRGAVATLAFLKARGTLAALAEEAGELGRIAEERLAAPR